MTTRELDPPEVKPHRLVAFGTVMTGVISAALLATAGNALLMWRTQAVYDERMANRDKQAEADRRYGDAARAELLVEIKGLAAKVDAKNQVDAQQTSDIRDHERRITRLEPRQ